MSFRLDERGVMRFQPWERRPWLRHGFSTRAAGDFREFAGAEAAVTFGADGFEVVTPRQTHSARVWTLGQALEAWPERLEGDALIMDRPGFLVGVRTADCAPILLADPETKAVAAVHAGWRGTAARIVEAAVEALERQFGCDPARLEAVIGPSIGRERYEVGEEVAERFEPEEIVRREGTPRPFLDLVEANRRQLLRAGLSRERVFAADLCTYDDERFFSYRRDGAAGRMLAVVGIAEPAIPA